MKKMIALLFITTLSLCAEDVYATFDIVANKEAHLTPKVGGEIEEIFVDVGEKVEKGAVLARLDNTREEIALKIANNTLLSAKLDFEHANKRFLRYQKIKDVIDQEQFDNFAFTKEMKKQAYLKAQNNYELSEKNYQDTFIKAPFSGTISEKFLDVGNTVGTQDPVVSIVDISSVKLILQFDEKHWKKVKVGQKFLYSVDGDSQSYSGKLTKLYPVANPRNRKIKAEVVGKNLAPGLFGDGSIEVQ